MASHGTPRVAIPVVRSEEARQKELQRIAAYQELVQLVTAQVAQRQHTVLVLSLVTKLLNENPEYYTIWNHRRRILGALLSLDTPLEAVVPARELIEGEMQLTFALLRKYPKCYWIWNHRNWVLRKTEALLEPTQAHDIWLGELQLVSKMLHADSRNFHAWGYRRFVAAQIERMRARSPVLSASPSSLVESEFDYTTRTIKANLSNFSAWHSRGNLIPHLLDERKADCVARRELFNNELALICTAINTDPFDQSIWYYHRFLISTLSLSCPRSSSIILDLTNENRERYYVDEIKYIRDILEDENDCKWIYESLLYLASCCQQLDGGSKAFTTQDMRSWLTELKRLDPLRTGRWDELGMSLNM